MKFQEPILKVGTKFQGSVVTQILPRGIVMENDDYYTLQAVLDIMDGKSVPTLDMDEKNVTS